MASLVCNQPAEYVEWLEEVNDIHKSQDEENITEDDIVTDMADEGDQATQFLKEVGLNQDDSESEMNSEIMSLLTITQLATIKKCMDTIRQKSSRCHHPDVRNIFSTAQDSKSGSCSPVFQTDGGACASRLDQSNAVLKDSVFCKIVGKTDEIYIPPPDYSTVEESIIRCGEPCIQISRPGSYPFPSAKTSMHPLSPDSTGSGSPLSPLEVFDDGFSGQTRICDLGKKDFKTLKSLANIELMALFEEFDIKYVRHKTKRKGKDHGIYGVPLQTLSDRDRNHDHYRNSSFHSAPLFLQQLIEHLEKTGLTDEGILRVPGGVARMKDIRQDINTKWSRGKFSFDDILVHDGAGLLKQFLRDLPDSLLTVEKMDAFLKILDIPDEKKRLYALNLLVLILPEVNRDTLQLLLNFLCKVIDRPENRMTLSSVSMIIAPNLFILRTGGSRNKIDAVDELQMASRTSKVVMMMIENEKELWKIPSLLLEQIRQKNEGTKKSRISLPVLSLVKRDRSDSYKLPQLPEKISVAQITVCLEDYYDTSVSINENTTSNDVINKVLTRSPKPKQKNVKSSSKSDQNETSNKLPNSPLLSGEVYYLYEVGGNIGERRLDRGTNIMSVYQINPNAKFVVRCKPM